jgi:uncharacterized protein YkwD
MLPPTKTLRGTLTILGMLLGLLAVPAGSAHAASPETAYAAAAFKATNKERTDRDRVALKQADCMQKYATRQAKKMANQQRIFHQALDPIEKECNLSRAGENVGYGFPTGKSLVVDGWMKSPPHRANILNRKYRLMAIAARQASDGRWYACQLFGTKA